MTQRERQASSGLSATARAPVAGGPAGPPAPSRPAAAPDAHPSTLWEDVFHNATPAQQQELLTLASRQGLLHAHQLPAPANGSRPHAPAPNDPRALTLLSHLLQGQTSELKPVLPAPFEPNDTDLDDSQRQAVARALATPDLCLIQGFPGAGKSRVVAEIVTQVAARGERVLLLSPAPAAVDRVLALVAGREAVCPLRCVGKGDRLEELSEAGRAATFPERVRSLREHALGQAVRAREQAERRCQRLRQEEEAWPRLEELAGRERRLRDEADALTARRERIPAEVHAEAERAADPAAAPAEECPKTVAAAAASLREALARLREAQARADKEHAEQTRAAEERAAEAEALRPLAEAKRAGRWWSPSWWRATFGGDVVARLAEREARRDEARVAVARLDAERARLDAERAAAEEAFQTEKRKWIDRETASRQAELDKELAALRGRREELEAEWAQICAAFADTAQRPDDRTGEAVHAARQRWQARREQDEQHCAFAREWAAYLEQSADGLAARLPGYANLVAATTTGLASDEHFGDAASCGGQFDLLVLDEAEQITEADLLRLSRRARRWVLVGECPPAPEWAPARGRAAGRGAPAPPARAQVFQRLWQTLHCDPARLPYAWTREGERLCCRLRPLAPEQRQWLESERLEDWPEVELRILASPRARPQLAEVLFPAPVGIVRAKEYIFRELQELPVVAAERCPRWAEEPERVVLGLADVGRAEVESVALEPGVREVVAVGAEGERAWHTCRLEFERQGGWDRARAEAWVERHLRLRDLGRTARLESAYRMAPELAEVVSDLLYDGGCRAAPGAAGRGGLLEFVAVPPLGNSEQAGAAGRGRERRPRGQSAVATRAEPRAQPSAFPRAGAGLEVDLAATAHGTDRLPAELRAALPRRGLVNLAEAHAVVRRLEELSAAEGPVAVIALYRAQAELIRRLVRESPALAAGGLRVEVDVPGAFRQREFPVVLVSLTRSHNHRAVPLGEEAGHLTLALTRARSRLVVFGDAGTLARRGQWEGALDHLDEAAAAREGLLAERLVRYLQGGGRAGRAFRLREGGGP